MGQHTGDSTLGEGPWPCRAEGRAPRWDGRPGAQDGGCVCGLRDALEVMGTERELERQKLGRAQMSPRKPAGAAH